MVLQQLHQRDYTFDQTTRSSIVKYTGNLTAGAKVAHGLGTTPDLIIIKDLNSTTTWIVYQSAISELGTKYLNFNENRFIFKLILTDLMIPLLMM